MILTLVNLQDVVFVLSTEISVRQYNSSKMCYETKYLCFVKPKIYSLEYTSSCQGVLFQIKTPWKVLVSTNINKHLSSFVDIWSSFHVNRRLCSPPPPYGCHLYHRPPLLWFLHCYRIRLMRLLSTWTQTLLLNSASIHLLLPCWCSASLTAAGKPIYLTLVWVQNLITVFKQYVKQFVMQWDTFQTVLLHWHMISLMQVVSAFQLSSPKNSYFTYLVCKNFFQCRAISLQWFILWECWNA